MLGIWELSSGGMAPPRSAQPAAARALLGSFRLREEGQAEMGPDLDQRLDQSRDMRVVVKWRRRNAQPASEERSPDFLPTPAERRERHCPFVDSMV